MPLTALINGRSKLETLTTTGELRQILLPKWTKFIPHEPTIKQQAALWYMGRELFYGGAVGGGKSDWILMAALQFVDQKGYAALIIRDTYANLSKSEGLLTRAHEWLAPWIKKGEVRWEEKTKTFHFLEFGSRLEFGYLDAPRDHFNYLSAAYHFVGIDEAVSVRGHQALFLFSRMRRLKSRKNIPIRFRVASNPPLFDQLERGEWVKNRYVDSKHEDYKADAVFIPAKIGDNPYLDAEEYIGMLGQGLDPISLRQLEHGDWEIQAGDQFFEVSKIRYMDLEEVPQALIYHWVRRYDLAATEDKRSNPDPNKGPAFTAGVLGAMYDGNFIVIDIVRGRLLPGDVDDLIVSTAKADGPKVSVRVEQEGGSAGKRDMVHIGSLLTGYDFNGVPSTGSKVVRARPLASLMSRGKVIFVRGEWNRAAVTELRFFPKAAIKDQVDAMSGCYSDLTVGGCGGNNTVVAIPNNATIDHNENNNLFYG